MSVRVMRRLRRPAIVIKHEFNGDSPHFSVSVDEMNPGEDRLLGVVHIHGDPKKLDLGAAPVTVGHVMILLQDTEGVKV